MGPTGRHPRKSRSRLARCGSSLIEFGLVAFVMILVLFLSIECDRMFFIYVNLADAAKAGTRYAIVRGPDRSGYSTSDIQNLIKSYITAVNPANLTVSVTYPDGSNSLGKHVKVAVQYTYDPWSGFGPLTGVTLSASSQGIIVF